MLHACFDFLCDYAEKEDPGFENLEYQWLCRKNQDSVEDGFTYTQKDINDAKRVYDEAVELYYWWQSTLPARKNGDWDSVDGHDAEVDDANLIRLIKIRRYLWT